MLVKNVVLKAVTALSVVAAVASADMITQTLHSTTAWQSLGVETIWDGTAGNQADWWLGDGGANTTSNNGVKWQVNGVGGFDNTDFDFNVGDVIDFEVTVFKEYAGGHDYDGLKVWVDDVIVIGEMPASSSTYYVTNSHNDEAIFDKSEWGAFGPGTQINKTFDAVEFSYTVTDDDLINGGFDVTARVSCSNDISYIVGGQDGSFGSPSNNDWKGFTKTNTFIGKLNGQGETEIYNFTVSTTNVPEPTIVSLIGISLLGLVFYRKKK